MLNYYFVRSETGENINKNLDFTHAAHFVLSYDWHIGTDYHLKIEPYIQHLYHVPVIPGSTYSFINLKGNEDWFVAGKVENEGQGRNYGLDVTFEKYMSEAYYFLLTGSLFSSRYKVTANGWYNTRYNRNYVFNFLFGKEWMLGKNKQNLFGANGKLSFQGGDRYSPIDETASVQKQDVFYNEQNPFSKQLSPALLGHFTLSYKINKYRKSHEFALKVLNITGYKEYYGHRYNFKSGSVDEEREAIIIPNISYKIEF
ncbi:MAG: hypothetical protein LBT25_11685 [Candidatus Symbiothrix sp.]|nr:hypothetical protein [Candidatus Symbiothrix sp.]